MLNKQILHDAFEYVFESKEHLEVGDWETLLANPQSISASLYHQLSANKDTASMVILELGFLAGLRYAKLNKVIKIDDPKRVSEVTPGSGNGGPEPGSGGSPASREGEIPG